MADHRCPACDAPAMFRHGAGCPDADRSTRLHPIAAHAATEVGLRNEFDAHQALAAAADKVRRDYAAGAVHWHHALRADTRRAFDFGFAVAVLGGFAALFYSLARHVG